MSYSARADIEAIFGTKNVEQYADLNDDGNATTISNAITNALAKAYADVNSIARQTHYTIPLANASGSVPDEVMEWEARLAGVKLHDMRGIVDGDNFQAHRDWLENFKRELLTGVRRLDCL